jgi:hypothetical protein
MPKKEFMAMVADVTEDPFSFLTINMKKPWPIRFRKNLGEIICIDRWKGCATGGMDEKSSNPQDKEDVGFCQNAQEGRGARKRDRSREGADVQQRGLGAAGGKAHRGLGHKVQKAGKGSKQSVHDKNRLAAAPPYASPEFFSRSNPHY